MAAGDHRKKNMLIIFSIGIVLLIAAIILIYLFIFARANGQLPSVTVKIGSATFQTEIADTMATQARGLSYRTSLGADDAMLFVFASATVQNFWMKDMNFPLDMIWIGDGKVNGFAENAAPQPGVPLWSLTIYSSPGGTDKVLEVNAGIVAKYRIKVGDPVTIIGGKYANN